MRSISRPLFRLDAGWLFLLAGLTLGVCLVIIPPQVGLHEMRHNLNTLRVDEARTIQRLKAYSDFLSMLEETDEVLTRRLAAAQLNLIPKSTTPVLKAQSASAPVTDWVESTVAQAAPDAFRMPETRLGRLATGELRQWLLVAGALSVFVGLMVGGRVQDDRASISDEELLPDRTGALTDERGSMG